MPQINRIRVNNVKYNFGTQVYDDFMMRFNCRNTIYDLANGGGKSLLMLLLMQNMLPNCTLDDKQPIEKLFRQGGGNTCIHSLVEWKLDACYQRDGFKYMTTGFCARKAKTFGENEEETSPEGASASVEYFNYCIFYSEFGDNDIKNLPLEKNGERITYNGLKNYLRELEKGNFKTEVKIFDRKGDYQSFISGYGIYESAWEIIRGINKTEGHVRTYFETNYKTSRKVVEDLLIEEIIQKSFNNRLSAVNDEGMMAQTLMDIKDKLVELSKKHSQMGAYDSQTEAINGFCEYLSTYEVFYRRKEEVEKQLYDLLLAAILENGRTERELEDKETQIAELRNGLFKERESIAVAEVMSEKASMAAVEALVKETRQQVELKNSQIAEERNRLALMESANDYADYEKYDKSYRELQIAMDNRLRADEDIMSELKRLAARYRQLYDAEFGRIKETADIASGKLSGASDKLTGAKASLRNADKEAAGFASLRDNIDNEIDIAQAKLRSLMADAGIVVAENAEDEYISAKTEKDELERQTSEMSEKFNDISKRVAVLRENEIGYKALTEILSEERKHLQERQQIDSGRTEKLDELRGVYAAEDNVGLEGLILETYRGLRRNYESLEAEFESLDRFITNAESRNYSCDDAGRDKLKEYLVSRYGEDVEEGREWFRKLNNGQKRDVLKRTPFVEYSFIIKNDFERIKSDETLANFGRGAVVYPIVSEQMLYDTKLEINKDLILFALKDMSFLRDDAKRETEVKIAKEERESLVAKVTKVRDRMNLVWDDYRYVLECNALAGGVGIQASVTDVDAQIASHEVKIIEVQEESANLSAQLNQTESELNAVKERLASLLPRCASLEKVIERSRTLDGLYAKRKEIAAKAQEALTSVHEWEDKVSAYSKEYDTACSFADGAEKALKELNRAWETRYVPYYDESVTVGIKDEIYNYDMEEIDRRFIGLSEALEDRNSDFADKKALIAHLLASMDKCRESVEYRGFTFDDIRQKVKNMEIAPADSAKLREGKAFLVSLEKESGSVREELESQEALLNRLEGSIAHGINQIEVNYGEYREFPCDNPEGYMEQHKGNIKKIESDVAAQEKEKKHIADNLKELAVCRRDLERIVTQAGMEIPEQVRPGDIADISVSLKEYEEVQKEYASVGKLEFKKADEFNKNKQKLIDLLCGYNAEELAEEVKVSLNVPESAESTSTMINSLKETNTFIQLEKDRVAKGIEDMEMIKDNFVNRCIQTCSNIKTELDRLGQLSNINLDGEQIAIIGLVVPYVKEEMYKEKMSEYIDETVFMADSFKDAVERLRYIRNRLTWKRLFSVIVTDMNGVRINLYKRERIKDQSRYLRYEEAVGSTGQSQGIYIQFLIAIINYISNMNSSGKEGVEGKTIFIDNPFGAAKDIYIWEPIFKLLETNHVQLIVPARGATPAITGRFDVNYVLGQKLVDSRQQTVVVDYYSSTKESELEYTRMDYEQATFDFL